MNTTSGTLPTGHSARIIVFPYRERMATKALPEQKFAAMEAAARRCGVASAASSWYHEAAIAEDDRR